MCKKIKNIFKKRNEENCEHPKTEPTDKKFEVGEPNTHIVDILNCLFLVFFILIAICCLISLIMGLITLRNTDLTFSKEYSDALKAIPLADGTNHAVNIENLITHMENMQSIQKNNVTNNLMSFVYGILSTILVGICTGAAAKSKSLAEGSKESAKEIKKVGEEIFKAEDKSKKQIEYLLQRVSFAAEQSARLNNNIKLMRIHSEIAYTKVALANLERVEANYRLHRIVDWMNSLSKEKNASFNKEPVIYLQEELEILNNQIDELSDRIEKLHIKNPDENIGRYESFIASIKNYKKWVKEAIQKCDELPKV